AGRLRGIGAILRDVTERFLEDRAIQRRIGDLERELAALRVTSGG
ncbi:MAG: hypothetical protein QOD81_4122, partial [Solirubrobacteraceae bacterium]|nr:hypothetical protein [Solirubrobacteraceae bacterium]